MKVQRKEVRKFYISYGPGPLSRYHSYRFSFYDIRSYAIYALVEQAKGIEPSFSVWKTNVLTVRRHLQKHILPTGYFTPVPTSPVLLLGVPSILVLIKCVVEQYVGFEPTVFSLARRRFSN